LGQLIGGRVLCRFFKGGKIGTPINVYARVYDTVGPLDRGMLRYLPKPVIIRDKSRLCLNMPRRSRPEHAIFVKNLRRCFTPTQIGDGGSCGRSMCHERAIVPV